MGIMLIVVLFYNSSFAQLQNSKWVLGDSALIDFSSGNPVVVKKKSHLYYAGITNVCDKDGNLILYSDGQAIYNKSDNVIAGYSEDLYADGGQVMFVPCPNTNEQIYYVFVTQNGREYQFVRKEDFTYLVIDMTKDNGNGAIVQQAKKLSRGSLFTPTACLHKNGTDIWIISNDYLENVFYAYLLTKDGLSTVVQSNSVTNISLIRMSPNGRYLSTSGIGGENGYALWEFNNRTGQIRKRNFYHLETNKQFSSICAEFDAESKFVYVCTAEAIDSAIPSYRSAIYQIDLCSKDTILEHHYTVLELPSRFSYINIKLAYDNKIYYNTDTAYNGNRYLSVISSPSSKGVLCDFRLNSFLFDYRYQVIPLNPPHIYNPSAIKYRDTSLYICKNQTKTLFGPSGMSDYVWSTGATTSMVSITNGGEYWLAFTDCSYRDTMYFDVSERNAPVMQLKPAYTVCAGGGGLTLNPGEANTYLWQDGSSNSTFTVNTSGKYTVEGTNVCGTTKAETLVTINEIEFPNVFTPNDDGINDTFTTMAGALEESSIFTVYNRWGKQALNESNYKGQWNGADLSGGVYYYEYEVPNCKTYKGWVEIIK